jgi:hypothetical protein
MQIKTRIRKSVAAEAYLGFIAWMLRSGPAFGQRGVYRLSDFFSSVVLPSEDPTASEGVATPALLKIGSLGNVKSHGLRLPPERDGNRYGEVSNNCI